MSGYEYIQMSFEKFANTVASCTELALLNRIKNQIDSFIHYIETSPEVLGQRSVLHPLNLIDLGERRQTVVDRWIVLLAESNHQAASPAA